jgi:hypothetical protein
VFGTRGIGVDGVLSVVLMFGLTADGEEERNGAGLAKHERISGLVDADVNVGRIGAPSARLSTSGRTASIESRDVRFRSKCGDKGEGLIATSVEMREGFFHNE